MIVDCHTHLMTEEQWGPIFAAEYHKVADRNRSLSLGVTAEEHWQACAGADRVIVFGLNARYLQIETPNEQIAGYVASHPEKLIGFVALDPADPDVLDELERGVQDLKLRGIKVGPMYQDVDPLDERFHEIYRRAERDGLPILFHMATSFPAAARLRYANPIRLDEVGIRYPELRVIIAHMGMPWFDDTIQTIRKHPHFYADTSIGDKPWWLYNALVAFHEWGVMHKLLLGSDFPVLTLEEQIAAFRRVNAVVERTGLPSVPDVQIDEIVHRDTLALLGLT